MLFQGPQIVRGLARKVDDRLLPTHQYIIFLFENMSTFVYYKVLIVNVAMGDKLYTIDILQMIYMP